MPVYPGAWVVGSSRLVSARAPSGFHSLELGTRASLDEVKRFYIAALSASGFEVEDLGIAPLNPAAAALLGIAGSLAAKRASTDDRIDIQIRTPDGLIPSRLLQIHWRKISETPALPSVPPPAPAGVLGCARGKTHSHAPRAAPITSLREYWIARFRGR